MDKEKIKSELVDISNRILTKYEEMDVVETISVMNMASKTVFLGSLLVPYYKFAVAFKLFFQISHYVWNHFVIEDLKGSQKHCFGSHIHH